MFMICEKKLITTKKKTFGITLIVSVVNSITIYDVTLLLLAIYRVVTDFSEISSRFLKVHVFGYIFSLKLSLE